MGTVRIGAIPSRIYRFNRLIYHTSESNGSVIGTLPQLGMFVLPRYLADSDCIPSSSGQFRRSLNTTADHILDSVSKEVSQDSEDSNSRTRVSHSSLENCDEPSLLSKMGVGCIVNRHRFVVRRRNRVQAPAVRRFSVTTSLDVISTISPTSTELAAFDKLFVHLVEDLTKKMFPNEDLATVMDWFTKVLHYNVPHGKKNRGIAVVESLKHLLPNATVKQLNQARILGWCIEFLQAYYLIADDIMDQSVTRRGRPCWYRHEGCGNIAINDSFYVNTCVYQLLKTYFRDEPYYTHILDVFHETDMYTVIGQGLDLLTSPMDGSVDLDAFSMDRYMTIVTYKTAYYSFYLPVAAAMYMAGVVGQESHDQAKRILLEMGHFFQVQDDYLDCYGDPAVTGKIGCDIEDNKCTWLINKALLLCNAEQRQILQDNYGRSDPTNVAKVKEIYIELNLGKEYENFERTSFETLTRLINESDSLLPKKMFQDFADKMYKRSR